MYPPGKELFWIHSLISVLSKKNSFSFFSCFEMGLILVAAASRQAANYKLNQSGAAAAACDTSLSSTLMPSNCLWRPLPVCFSAWTPTQPHRSQALPLCSLSAPRLHYRWVFIPHVMFHQRSPSCGLRLSKSGGIERATGVRWSRRRVAVALTLAASLRA